jgi:hypothetical protein
MSTFEVQPEITCQCGSAMQCCKGQVRLPCDIYILFAHLLPFVTRQILRFSHIRLNGSIYLFLIVNLL